MQFPSICTHFLYLSQEKLNKDGTCRRENVTPLPFSKETQSSHTGGKSDAAEPSKWTYSQLFLELSSKKLYSRISVWRAKYVIY